MSIIIFFLYSTVFNSLAQLSFMSLIEYISTYLGSVCLLPYGPSVAYHCHAHTGFFPDMVY